MKLYARVGHPAPLDTPGVSDPVRTTPVLVEPVLVDPVLVEPEEVEPVAAETIEIEVMRATIAKIENLIKNEIRDKISRRESRIYSDKDSSSLCFSWNICDPHGEGLYYTVFLAFTDFLFLLSSAVLFIRLSCSRFRAFSRSSIRFAKEIL